MRVFSLFLLAALVSAPVSGEPLDDEPPKEPTADQPADGEPTAGEQGEDEPGEEQPTVASSLWAAALPLQLPAGADSIDPADARGKHVVLLFLYLSGPGARSRYLPAAAELVEHFAGDEDVSFIAVETGHGEPSTPEAGRAALAEFGLTELPLASDRGTPEGWGPLARAYELRRLPSVVLLDRDGTRRGEAEFFSAPQPTIARIEGMRAGLVRERPGCASWYTLDGFPEVDCGDRSFAVSLRRGPDVERGLTFHEEKLLEFLSGAGAQVLKRQEPTDCALLGRPARCRTVLATIAGGIPGRFTVAVAKGRMLAATCHNLTGKRVLPEVCREGLELP